ncbi:hypothetical protein [Nostocoides sp.]|uniref:hypothetical protein n=1 Tax=Nostocoides sp. TaxID=1917966 RepID=UPI002B6A1076|nr:hypothetical protein [Tetrasphaera sp.]
MTTLPLPAAARLRRPSWRDTRLLSGIALVLLATALGAYGLRAADSRVPVYAAREVLVPGQRLTLDALVQVDVQLSGAKEAYLAVAGGLPSDGYVLREVRAGELIPRASVGPGELVEVSPLTIVVDQASAGALVVGSVVDVYANTPATQGTRDTWEGPQRVLERVQVARLTSGSGFGAASGRSAVQALIPRDRVASVIALVDSGAKFTLVPVPGSALRELS